MNKFKEVRKSTIKGMSDEKFTEHLHKGHIVKRYDTEIGQHFEGANGRSQVKVNAGGTVENLIKKRKMSKKDRKAWRKAMFEDVD